MSERFRPLGINWATQNFLSVNMERVNYWFNFSFFALSAIVGSAVSVLLTAAFIWAVICLMMKRFAVVEEKSVIMIAAVFALFPAAELLSVVVNNRGLAGISAAAGSFLFLAIVPVASRVLLSSPQAITNAVGRGAAVCAIVSFAYACGQIIFTGIRPEAGFGNSAVFSVCALVHCCICLTLLPAVSRNSRNLLIAGFACALACVVVSATRSVWLATPFCLAVAIIPMFWFKPNLVFGAKSILFAMMIGAAIPFGASIALNRVSEMVSTMRSGATGIFDQSIDIRMAMYRGGWEQVKASWVFGYGPDSPQDMLLKLGAEFTFQSTHYHNLFLNSLIRGGIIELLAVLSVFWILFAFVFKKSLNRHQFTGRILICSSLIAFGISSMFGILFSHDILNALFIYVMIIGVCLGVSKDSSKGQTNPSAVLRIGLNDKPVSI